MEGEPKKQPQREKGDENIEFQYEYRFIGKNRRRALLDDNLHNNSDVFNLNKKKSHQKNSHPINKT